MRIFLAIRKLMLGIPEIVVGNLGKEIM